MQDKIKRVLKNKFGFSNLRTGQKNTIDELLAGNNVLSILPTGAGKTLIYQLYGYLINKPVVIVSPLLSLMSDQVSRMNYMGEKQVVAINSNFDWKEKQIILNNLNQYHYIFISPEMLSQESILKNLKRINIGLFVIDEAHCISKWGIDFRPDYLDLGHIREELGDPQTLMLTATASRRVRCDIVSKMNLKNYQVVLESVNRPNIYLGVHRTNNEYDKQNYLLKVLRKLHGPGIIYFSSKKKANEVAEMIKEKLDIKTAAYHADLNNEDRFKIQHQFMDNELQLICATNAFGMGINKSDVRFVIHYHMSQDLGSYVQEIGRSGRDGKQSLALILYSNGDENIAANLINNSIPNKNDINYYQEHKYWQIDKQKKRLLDFYVNHGFNVSEIQDIFENEFLLKKNDLTKMYDYIIGDGCRRKRLLAYFDEQFNNHDSMCCDFGDQNNMNINMFDFNQKHLVSQGSDICWQQIIDELFGK